ncbi:symplekin [Diaphorina citri]|uniref:Symplekin n=1 Tax=Diaphorina citri TaxID=121845 RepID=A0A1S4EG90_DIACI|nr:symplekin [Diaphorina citri]
MISLHTIDGAKVDLKYVIKATSLCFSETAIYTQEVLALVLQNLIEVNPLPTLFMRTVIQSLSHFPRLIGFIMNILQRLILKQVWEQKTVWEGFIKCCQRTVPNSYQVILQLPPKQLADLFSKCPELKNPLLDHVLSFTENQRSHIPQGVMDVLYGDVNPIYETLHIKSEPKSPPDLSIDMKETQQVM